MSTHRDIVVVMDPNFIRQAETTSFDSLSHQFPSQVSLVRGLRETYDTGDFAFLKPARHRSELKFYELGDERIVHTDEDIDAKKLIVFSVDSDNPDFNLEDLSHQYATYNSQSRFPTIFNPSSARMSLDKALLGDLAVNLPTPHMYAVKTWDDMKRVLLEGEREVVMKHRVGAEGNQVYKLNPDNLEATRNRVGESLEEYVVQQLLDIQAESRIMIFGDEVVGSRIIHNRVHPWERGSQKGLSTRRYSFNPPSDLLREALDVHNKTGLVYGAVDFAHCPDGVYLLEVNGVCPGLVTYDEREGEIYDLGKRFSQFLYGRRC